MVVDNLQSHGDECYSSNIGQALEDEFASKASLAEDGEDSPEYDSDDSDDSVDSDGPDLILRNYSSNDNDGVQGRFLYEFTRSVVQEGQEVILPANLWYICLKDGPPEGCNGITNHLNILEQVVGSDAKEVYMDAYSETTLTAVLTDEEHEKLSGMEQVESSSIVKYWLEVH